MFNVQNKRKSYPVQEIISMGEYIINFEKQLQQEILSKIQKIRYGKNGYIVVVDEKGINLSHVNKKLIGTNILYIKDAKGSSIVRNIIDLVQKKIGFIKSHVLCD